MLSQKGTPDLPITFFTQEGWPWGDVKTIPEVLEKCILTIALYSQLLQSRTLVTGVQIRLKIVVCSYRESKSNLFEAEMFGVVKAKRVPLA